MNGFRFFPIHILIKDLSFMIFYCLLIKYVFTKADLSSIAHKTTLWDMISGALFYNIIPLIVSLIFYFPIVYGIKKIKLNEDLKLVLTGLLLTVVLHYQKTSNQ